MLKNDYGNNGYAKRHASVFRRVCCAAVALAMTLLAVSICADVALADGDGFDSSGGGDIDEQETGWWDGLPNIMEIIQTTLFPSYTYDGGGSGHAFGDWGYNDNGSSSTSSSSSDSGQTQPSVGEGALVFSGNVLFENGSSYRNDKMLTDDGIKSNDYYHNPSSALPDSLTVICEPDVFSGLDESANYALLIQLSSSSNTSNNSISIQLQKVDSISMRTNKGKNQLEVVDAVHFLAYNSLKTVSWNNDGHLDSGYNGYAYTYHGGVITISKKGNATSITLNNNSSGNQSSGYSNLLFPLASGGGGDNPSGGGDNPSGGGDNPSGGGGGIDVHFGGDTYNHETNNYNNYTYVGENQVDLTPVTKRQDMLIDNTSQIGRDLESLAVVMDYDLRQVYYAVLSQAALQKRGNDYLASMESDLELVVQALNNLQDNSGLSTVRGYLKKIYDELAAWPDYPQPTQVNIPDPVATDLSGVESKLDEVIRLLRSGTHENPTIVHDEDNDIGTEIGEKMQQVAQRFPFSVPWDVMHILGLLRSERVAPQFDLPVIGSEESIHVDLSGWEPVAVVTRSGTFVLFALGLALRSKSLVTSWSGGNA